MRPVAMALLATALVAGAAGCAATPVARVNCGGEKDYVDPGGGVWLADRVLAEGAEWGAVGGLTIRRAGLKIPDCEMAELYVTERYSMTAYQFSLPNGTYTVRLHFAETYERHSKAGERIFTVKVNGEEKLKDLDVLNEAGGFAKPLVKECAGVAVTDGKLKVEFVPKVQNPEINAIEILR